MTIKKTQEQLDTLESTVHSESAKWLAFYTGHENILKNQDRRMADIESGIDKIAGGVEVLSDGMRQFGDLVRATSDKLAVTKSALLAHVELRARAWLLEWADGFTTKIKLDGIMLIRLTPNETMASV